MIFHGFSIFSSFFNGFWITIGQFQGLPIVVNGFYTFLLSLRYISLEAKRAKGLCHVSWYEKGMRNLWGTSKFRINNNPWQFTLRFTIASSMDSKGILMFLIYPAFVRQSHEVSAWDLYSLYQIRSNAGWVMYWNRCCVHTTNHKREFMSRILVWETYEKPMRS